MLALAGCSTGDYRLFHPVGAIAHTELLYTIIDVGVMLIIILPVAVMIGVFSWRYHHSRNATHTPDWSHSLTLEFLVWGVPLIMVAALGYFSFKSIFMVNPYGPTVLESNAAAPLDVDVITTDWQWIFVYPAQHIATIDELEVPAGRNVQLRLTSTSVMNGFYIPQLAPMIDVMPGMRTKDAFESDQTGNFEGFSTDFSGAGFSWMRFATKIVAPADFDKWISTVQASPTQLSYAAFQKLAQPTVNVSAKPAYFSNVDPKLFEKVYDAANAGVVYPVPAALTKSIADVSAQGPQASAAK
ncbi:MAG: hypothetical protein B7Z81_01000 [Acidocella sp. 20-61-6]|nr:MAG: hypothetical protein B7Z81_01000 [Acidocella sp. 20-61-6]